MDYVPVSSLPRKEVRRYVIILALIVTLGPLFYSFEGMVLNGATRAVGNESNLDVFAKGVAGAAGIIGGLIGASIAGRLSNHVGRRGVLILVGPALLFEAMFGALSPRLGGYPFLLLCRVIGGMDFGSAITAVPGYAAEVSPERICGRLISFRQLIIILGLFSAAIVNLIATEVAGDSTAAVFLGLKAWQVILLCPSAPTLIHMILTPLIPESPRYLVVKSRLEEADKVLRKLTGQDDISGKIREIQGSLGGRNAALRILAVLKSKWRTLVMVSMAIAALQQLTDTSGMFFYPNMLFEAVRIPEPAAFLQTLILSIFKIVGVTTRILLADRIGRKNMLIYGGTLMFIALDTVTTVFLVAPTGKDGSDTSSSPILGSLAVVSLCLFLLDLTSPWGLIFSVLIGEVFPNQVHGSAMSLSAEADFFFNLLVVLLFPYLVSWSPSVTYWIYCFFGVLAVIFIKRYVQKTKSKSLEDMGKQPMAPHEFIQPNRMNQIY